MTAEIVLGKYLHHQPLYRQAKIMEWEAGVKLPLSTMCQTPVSLHFHPMLLPFSPGAERPDLLGCKLAEQEETRHRFTSGPRSNLAPGSMMVMAVTAGVARSGDFPVVRIHREGETRGGRAHRPDRRV